MRRAFGVLVGREVLVWLRKGRLLCGATYEREVFLLKKGMEEMPNCDSDIPARYVDAGIVAEYHPRRVLKHTVLFSRSWRARKSSWTTKSGGGPCKRGCLYEGAPGLK